MAHPALAQIYEAFEAGLDFMMADMPGAWIIREENLRAVSAPLPWPAFNGLSITGPVEHARVAELVHRVEAAGHGCSITTRPGNEAFAASAIEAFGLTPDPRPDPLMVLPLKRTSVSAPPSDFVIQRVEVTELELLIDLAVDGFEMPRWMAELTNTPSMLASPTVATYVGKVGGVPVGTTMSSDCSAYAPSPSTEAEGTEPPSPNGSRQTPSHTVVPSPISKRALWASPSTNASVTPLLKRGRPTRSSKVRAL